MGRFSLALVAGVVAVKPPAVALPLLFVAGWAVGWSGAHVRAGWLRWRLAVGLRELASDG